ncbi:1-phosphatidylinositol 4,5-bisphosphate phosphodiesterase beta-1-like isoform X3 [Dreissena polymorpha]|uniref:1-phosphatidylinositol 4,5-bisphosphate phosphodiesterase beta-1-like isoform X3 n=1 Tax=Dreissena polymorpha TaxID=45954 RepID=UPI0022656512|nr:1-phosphatidylinositol 4,5-bisphosphate phosphodiesterase beta-1-like isoform X3 [Dreissena polymorpha]
MAGAKLAVHVVQLKPVIVPETLVKGNKFIKWDDNSTIGLPVTLRVDPKGYYLYWRDQNKDMDCLDISYIRDTRTGKYAKVPKDGKLRETCLIGPSDVPLEDKTVTIAYGNDMVNIEFYNFVCASRELATFLCEELLKYANNLLALNGSCLTFLEKAHTRLTHVLDVNGKIPVKNITRMITKDNKDDKKRVEKALETMDFKASKTDTIDPNKFTFDDFFTFYRHLIGRTEVDKVFDEIGAKKKPYLTSEQFVKFLNDTQRDPRLNEILYPYFTSKQALDLINKYETKPSMAAKGHFSQEGFLKFLMGEDNNLIPAEHLDLNQDMTQPLSHYFINSSHNTYLTGHQLTGKSSVEVYSQVLLSGCRCIELDCWDGKGADEEPMITHGFTMCTEVPFKDVIEAIAHSAFKTSDYPVILSFENHCSQKQQAKMAAHCRNIFGDMLLIDPLDGFPLEPNFPLPSPELLKRKIIVKNRKKHYHKKQIPAEQTKTPTTNPRTSRKQVSVDNSGGEEMSTSLTGTLPPAVEEVPPTPTATEKPPDGNVEDQGELEESDSSESDDDDEVPGLTEERLKQEKGTAGSEAEAGSEMSALVNYVQPVHFHSFEVSDKKGRAYEISSFVETQATNLLKEYPVEFVNYNKRQMSRIYPRGTRVDSSNFMPQIFWNAGCQLVALNFQTLDLAMQLNLGIFEYNCRSGYILKPDFMRRFDKHFDPFAESVVDGIVAGTVSVKVISGQFLSDKRVSTYVEVDMFGLPTDTHRKKFRSRTVQNNGINPVYDEPPFVFKKVVLPNLAVIRIGVYEETGKMIGHRVLYVQALRPGYRHISLRNECNQPLVLPSLFVHISVKDYVMDMHAEFAEALADPLKHLSKMSKHKKQLEVFFPDDDDKVDKVDVGEKDDGAEKRQGKLSDVTRPSEPSFSPMTKNGRNGSLPNINGAPEPILRRTPSNPHSTLTKKDSTFSNNSDGSGCMNSLRTRFSEPNLLTPTPLRELQKEKAHLKMLHKREKDLEILKKKHEKEQDSLREMHSIREEKLLAQQQKELANISKTHSKLVKRASKSGSAPEVEKENAAKLDELLLQHEQDLKVLQKSQAEVFVNLCMDQYKRELDLSLRHSDPIYDTLQLVMDQDHKEHEHKLKAIHDHEVKELTKQMDARTKEEMKQLQKKSKDKQAVSRLKRENQKRHIDTVVAERQKLKEMLDNRLDDLRKKQEDIKDQLVFDKAEMEKKLVDEFNQKCARLKEQHRHLLELDLTMPRSRDPMDPDLSPLNGGSEHVIKTHL